MEPGSHILFAPFRLDLRNQCLWRDERVITLTPKAFAVLMCLVKHHSQLVTKEELLNTVWPETYVTDAALKVCIGELRRALGDDARQPRFIETAHRRGYRFIGTITEARSQKPQDASSAATSATTSGRFSVPLRLRLSPPRGLVGREAILAQLHGWLERALEGERQVVFIMGEAGIGKTTLVESFLLSAARDPQVWIAQGQCLEQFGVGEAYLPVFEAVSRLCQEPGRERLLELLRRRAPTWLLQMPWLVSAADQEAFEREAAGATRERMLREMAEAIEALTVKTPLVMALEDLHWSDYSTLDLISYLARRREPARLLLICAYRPADVISSGHPLKGVQQELKMSRRCEELALEFLSEAAVGEYLAARFPDSRLRARLARLIHERTEGSPLFLVNVVDYLVDRGLIAQVDGKWEFKVETEKVALETPENVRQMIEKQIDLLGKEDQRVLEAASVAGAEFSAAAVAAALEEDVVKVEDCCEELARRRQFLQASQTSEPSNRAAARYGFIHTLYQNALYHRIPTARRSQLHRRIGECEEASLGERAGEIAAELAMHFEQGRDFDRAVNYLQQAADNANRRFAHQEAVMLARRGIELLKNLPDTEARDRRELALQMALCMALPATQGYGAAEVGKSYNRARELCERLGEGLQLFRVLRGLRNYYLFRAEFKVSHEICERLLSLAQSNADDVLLVQSHHALGVALIHLGEFAAAMEHFEQGLALYNPRQRHYHISDHRFDPEAALRCAGAWAQWFLGYPDQALNKIREALSLAEDSRHPENLCLTIFYATFLHQLRREAQRTLELAEALIAQAGEYGLAAWSAIGTSLRGWALVESGRMSEGIAQIRHSFIAHGEAGSEVARLHFRSLLAEALMKDEQVEEALALVDETLGATPRTGGYYFLAELYRLKGELLLNLGSGPWDCGLKEAEECFHQSIRIARRQSAKSLELRAVLSLSRLWQRQNKIEEARQTLLEIYNWFTEGFDTEDLKEARVLLDELA
ncbi:MAG: AAA family ATPase [Acidobacteria bacterium]|nr:AAA family ATPase [Acidobacteriota bacterium]